MTTDQNALLAAIRANPDDDTARLVYADWLDEHGARDRAEFIRLQIGLSNGNFKGDDHWRALDREEEMKRLTPQWHTHRWQHYYKPEWKRGFIHKATFKTVHDFLRYSRMAFEHEPLQTVRFKRMSMRDESQALVDQWRQWPISGLQFDEVDGGVFIYLSEYERAHGIKRLDVRFSNAPLRDVAIRALMQADGYPDLHDLGLHGCLYNGLLGELIESSLLGRLTALNILDNPELNDESIRRLLAAPGMAGMQELGLSQARLEDMLATPHRYDQLKRIWFNTERTTPHDIMTWDEAGAVTFQLALSAARAHQHSPVLPELIAIDDWPVEVQSKEYMKEVEAAQQQQAANNTWGNWVRRQVGMRQR